MKKTQKLIALLIVLSFLLPTVSMLPIGAASETEAIAAQKKQQKVVAVVYDDSGSMTANIEGKANNIHPTRADYALYSIKMLMALLNEGDILQLVPMNKTPKQYTLVGDGRQKQIVEIVDTKIFTPNGGTPFESVDTALNQLMLEGLKDANNLTTQDENKDFWLFVLTDGEFSGVNNTPKDLKGKIDKYPSLKTIYFGFSSGAVDLRNTVFESELSTAYMAADGDELVKGMQSIANQLSGRYNHTEYTLNGDTLKINFDKSVFAIKNLSVLALNCGAEIKSITYQGKSDSSAKDVTNLLKQSCVITPDDIPGIVPGYSGLIEGDPYFSGGTMTIKFSAPVKEEYLSIFAEPALVLSPTFKVADASGKMISVDSDYITGGKVYKGQTIKVGYECLTVEGKKIDIASAFNSKVKASVTYAGTVKNIPDGSTETDITLVEGPNNITITVNVEGATYKMYTSVNCNILADQTSYRVTAEHGLDDFSSGGSAVASYKVFVNNSEKTPAQLKADGFSWYIEITDPNGTVERVDNPEINGKIACEINSKSGANGDYKVYFRVISTLGWRMDEATYSYVIDFDNVEIRTSSPETLNKGIKETNVIFTVHSSNVQLNKRALENYDLKMKVVSYDGTETDVTPTVDDNGNISTVVKINPNVYGAYKVSLSVTSKTSTLTKEHTHTFKIYPSSVVITGEHEDAFKSGETKTSAKYRIKVDGVQLTKDQLDQYNWSLKTYLPGGVNEYGNSVKVEPDGTICAEFDVAGSVYGAYESRLEIAFSDEYSKSYSNSVKNYPTNTTINVVGSQKLSISQHQMTTNDKPVQFELFSDGGLPLVFNNGITTYKVLVDGKDVTQYATIDGNVLSYAPHIDHFGTVLSLGDHNVEVRVDSAELPALAVSASTAFEIKNTLYEVISLDSTNKRVERFKLKDMDVAIHFQVLRDGVPLPLDELTAALEAGEITVKDQKGTFTWEFWLPCGRDISVKEVNGQAVIEFRVTRDIGFLALDKVMGMFFFTGDKPISVTYNGVTGIDSITIERGAVWVYLLIWFIIFFIIHVILFAIGFINGKCKNLPTGTFIYLSLLGNDTKMVSLNTENDINTTFADKWLWHLGRFFLYGCIKRKKLWYHQPSKSISFGGNIGYYNGRLGITFENNNIYKAEADATRTKADRAFKAYKSSVSKKDPTGSQALKSERLELGVWKNYFRIRERVAVKPMDFLNHKGFYLECKKDGTFRKVIVFIEKR